MHQNNKLIFAKGARKNGIDETGAGIDILFSGKNTLYIFFSVECY